MIDARELRIGNWIIGITNQYNAGVVVRTITEKIRVENVNDQGINGEFDYEWCKFGIEDLEPIPLTPEILEKCGFVKNDDFEIYFTYGFVELWKVDGNHTKYQLAIKGGHKFIPSYVEYLHQLQNLYFALTNQELSPDL